MKDKENENLSGSYTDKGVTIIGNNKKTKPVMRDLNTIPLHEIQDALDKQERAKQKRILMSKEQDRQLRLEHPTIAKMQPYIMVAGVLVTIVVLAITFWIIGQVNSSVDKTINPNLTQFILMKLTRLMK